MDRSTQQPPGRFVAPLLAVGLFAGARLAWAQTPAAEVAPAVSAEPTAAVAEIVSKTGKSDSVAEVKAGGVAIEFRGRVMASVDWRNHFARLPAAQEDGTQDPQPQREGLALDLDTARAGIKVRVRDSVVLVLDAEFAGKAGVKDAFVQYKKKHWLARAGQFKVPASPFTLESPWTIPLARRGVLHELIADRMQLFGRRQGAVAQLRGGGSLDPSLTIGAFEGVDHLGDVISPAKPLNQTFMSRLEVTPGGHEIAAVGMVHTVPLTQSRKVPGSPASENGPAVPDSVVRIAGDVRDVHFWAAGLDGKFDWVFEKTGLRLWTEFYVGSQFHDDLDDANSQATFVEGRALGAYRWGGLTKGDSYLETFATVGALDPDLEVKSDLAFEAIAGLTVGHWRETRLTLQVERGSIGTNLGTEFFPKNKLGQTFQTQDYLTVVLEAGAAF